jgi:Zn ribbon nucleic-acid-binding protein
MNNNKKFDVELRECIFCGFAGTNSAYKICRIGSASGFFYMIFSDIN